MNHEAAKAALILAAVDPHVGGVCLLGGHGTCKTALARAVREILPPIEVVNGSYCNEKPKEVGDKKRTELGEKKEGLYENTSVRSAPFLTIPLGATEDAVCGSIDLESSAKSGTAKFSPGILARANRGIVFMDDFNLLDDAVVNVALGASNSGFNSVEREGISLKHPCDVLTIAAANLDEGEVRQTVLDRFAAVVGVDETFSLANRVAASTIASRWKDDWRDVLSSCADAEENLRLDVAMARARLESGAVEVPTYAIEYLVDRAMKGRCQGHRAELCACKFARAACALRGGTRVEKQDLRVAVELAIVNRDTVEVEDELEDLEEEIPGDKSGADEPEERPSERGNGEADNGETGTETDTGGDTDYEDDTHDDIDGDSESSPQTLSPDQIVIEPSEAVDVSAKDLLSAFDSAAKRRRRHESGGSSVSRSRSKSKTKSLDRGRYVKAEFPKAGVVRKVAIDATLRAAAIHQKYRREKHGVSKDSKNPNRVYITKDDLRNKRMSKPSGSLTVFLVDASGSMALHRADVAKGAALLLLNASFSKRDQVALVAYGGDFATVVLPPSRSLQLAQTRLAEIPSGGGTPLAHGLVTAGRLAYIASKFKQNVGSSKVVLLTDGGVNVTLAKSMETERMGIESGRSVVSDNKSNSSDTKRNKNTTSSILSEIPSKALLRKEAIEISGRLGKKGVRVFVVDCSRRFENINHLGVEQFMDPQEELPKAMARVARGSYYRLAPTMDAKRAGETLAGVLNA